MSAINSALSQLAEKNTESSQSGLQRAEVKPVKQRAILPWVVGSFALSLGVGGWAISQQAPDVNQPQTSTVKVEKLISQPINVISPTGKMVSTSEAIYQPEAPIIEQSVAEQSIVERSIIEQPIIKSANSVEQAQPIKPNKKVNAVIAKPPQKVTQPAILVAQAATKQTDEPMQQAVGEVIVEQVNLTPQQLAEKAKLRAEKALDANNLKDALSGYSDALRYTPNDAIVRTKLSALYYGKGEARKAAELLQKGISLDGEDLSLRLALAKLLIKEKQNAAALTVLVDQPKNVSIDYLSLRAALAQKQKQNAIALESYQQLVTMEPDSGRWWLGLAIQQERAFDLTSAKESYTHAQRKLGLSSQSQQFIRDRLTLIQSLEEQPSEN